jgi:uncharacterized membrane protein YfcA
VYLRATQCAGSGIGGGGVLVPLYIVAWGFHTEHAVALSNLTIAGGALANFVCNVKRCAASDDCAESFLWI